MDRIPFSPEELNVLGKYPARGANPNMMILNTPVTPKENLLALYRKELPLWVPQFCEIKPFGPRVLPENQVRGMVLEANRMAPSEFGGPDMFGVEWVFSPDIGGSMVKPGAPKVKDLSHWEDYVTLPDPDSWDWAGSLEANRDFVVKGYGQNLMRLTMFTGYFERLISLIDFEDAAVAMIDEDEQEHVHRLFAYLTDLYIKIIDHVMELYPINLLQLHDDWGSQMEAFFSLDTVREMIVPHLKRLVEHCHSIGLFFDLHSCGRIKRLVPAMIEAGVDSWQPQAINDTWDLYRTYGDKIIIFVIPESTPKGLSPEEYDAMARQWVEENIEAFRAHPFIMLSTPMDPFGKMYIDPEFTRSVYKYSRLALDK